MADYVINRSGQKEPMQLDRIGDRVETLGMTCGKRLENYSKLKIMKRVTPRIESGMTTLQIDGIVADVCAGLSSTHPDYSALSARIVISNLHRRKISFLDATKAAFSAGRIAQPFLDFVTKHASAIESRIDHSRDYNFDALGSSAFLSSYVKKDKEGKPVETPQHTYMRLALMLNCFDLIEQKPDFTGMKFVGQTDNDLSQRWVEAKSTFVLRMKPDENANLEKSFTSYEYLSNQIISHATPTVNNIGTLNHQLASCFLISTSDSLNYILGAQYESGMASKGGGGVGVDLGSMRSAGQPIRKTGGKSSGVMRFHACMEKTQEYADQGGTRKGAFVDQLPAHHADSPDLIASARSHGEMAAMNKECQDIKIAIIVPDLFWKKLAETIRTGKPVTWYMFSPDTAPGLNEAYDQPGGRQQYTQLYERYVQEKRYVKTMTVAAYFSEILHTQSMIGIPYIINKDQINIKNNLVDTPNMDEPSDVAEPPVLGRNGVIRISNLCTEIAIPTDNYHTGVCVLGALNLTKFVKKNLTMKNGVGFDFNGLRAASEQLTRHLDQVISISTFPSEGARDSTMTHRPIGIGVAGFYDVLCMMKLEYGEAAAQRLDQAIHAIIYYGSAWASSELAEEIGAHPSFEHTRMAKGQLQPDLWVKAGHLNEDWDAELDETLNEFGMPGTRKPGWLSLRDRIKTHGSRNGLLTAGMPTASTSSLMGCSEAATPRNSQITVRKLMFGMATLINPHLLDELKDLWTEDLRKEMVTSGGSIQDIENIPADIRRRYKTSREIEPQKYIYHVAARGPFISQSVSNNWFLEKISGQQSTALYLLAHRLGLTTASYYVHTKPLGSAHSLGAKKEFKKKPVKAKSAPSCSIDNPDCESCSV